MTHEDVRKSLEILDNVLAQFDDGVGDAWTCYSANGELNSHDKELVSNGDKNNAALGRDDKPDASPESSESSFRQSFIDGTASHDTAPSIVEEDKRFSPPPVPKRNPATRLSSQDDLSACSSFENICSSETEIPKINIRAREHRRQILSANENSRPKTKTNLTSPDAASSCSLSNQSTNNELMSKKASFESDSVNDNDDVFISYAKLTLSRSASAHAMATESILQKSPSVASRRALYEKTNFVSADDAKRPIDKNGKTHPVANSPLLRRKFTLANSPVFHKRNVSDSTDFRSSKCKISSMELVLSDTNRSQPTINQLPIANSETSDVIKEPLVYSFSQATKDRIALLDRKFAEVRHLLKTKQIVPLDCEPPRFVPTPPPPKKIPRKQYDIIRTVDNCDSGIVQSSNGMKDCSSSLSKRDVIGLKCPVTLIDTIADISCISPMDTSTRPPLGLSYSMEDDLNPGVKEILASTPKSDKPMLGLSTFSQSVSSLGYSSGQSDLDLSSSVKEDKKIPVTSLKSQTLPIGIKLGPPFSYVTDIYSDCDRTDRYEVSKSKNISEKIMDDHFRSSSAPPLKHLQRKNRFGISLKVQSKEKNKKDDCISLKSDVSVDDGIILRKMTTIDGSTEINDLSGRKQATTGSEEKTKRRSVWKSILRRK